MKFSRIVRVGGSIAAAAAEDRHRGRSDRGGGEDVVVGQHRHVQQRTGPQTFAARLDPETFREKGGRRFEQISVGADVGAATPENGGRPSDGARAIVVIGGSALEERQVVMAADLFVLIRRPQASRLEIVEVIVENLRDEVDRRGRRRRVRRGQHVVVAAILVLVVDNIHRWGSRGWKFFFSYESEAEEKVFNTDFLLTRFFHSRGCK